METSASNKISSAVMLEGSLRRAIEACWDNNRNHEITMDPARSHLSRMLLGNNRSHFLAEHDVGEIAGSVHIENDDRDLVVHAKAEGCRILHFEPLGQGLGGCQAFKEPGARIHLRVPVINAVDLRCFQDD